MNFNRFVAACALSLAGFAGATHLMAETPSPSDDGPGAVYVDVDLQSFGQSSIGTMLVRSGAMLVAQELDKDPDQAIESVKKSLGFDPFEQNARLSIQISDFENPAKDLQVALQLKDSTGNLEGLLLAAPGYESSKHGRHRIHSVALDDQAMHIGFHKSGETAKYVVASDTVHRVTSMLDQIDGGGRTRSVRELPQGQFVSVRLLSVPDEIADEPPFSSIIALIDDLSISVGEKQKDLVVKVHIVAKAEDKAEQLQQLAQGVVVMASLFEEEIREELDGEEGADAAIEVLNEVNVQREGKQITVGLTIPEKILVGFLREQAELPLQSGK